jgi:hypothetical protein
MPQFIVSKAATGFVSRCAGASRQANAPNPRSLYTMARSFYCWIPAGAHEAFPKFEAIRLFHAASR